MLPLFISHILKLSTAFFLSLSLSVPHWLKYRILNSFICFGIIFALVAPTSFNMYSFSFVRVRFLSLFTQIYMKRGMSEKKSLCASVCVCVNVRLTLSMAPLVCFQHMLRHDLTPFGRLVVHQKQFCRLLSNWRSVTRKFGSVLFVVPSGQHLKIRFSRRRIEK